jgi:hypothetical protein
LNTDEDESIRSNPVARHCLRSKKGRFNNNCKEILFFSFSILRELFKKIKIEKLLDSKVSAIVTKEK